MSFTSVDNVRIKSLKPGAVVRLRLGKAAVKNDKDDTIVTAKMLRSYEEGQDGEKTAVVFEEDGPDGPTELTVTQLKGATWRCGRQYVSLVAVDASTYTVKKAAAPIDTEVIGEAITLVTEEQEDVWAWKQLVELMEHIKTAKRVNTDIKALVVRLAHGLIDDLSKAAPMDDENKD